MLMEKNGRNVGYLWKNGGKGSMILIWGNEISLENGLVLETVEK